MLQREMDSTVDYARPLVEPKKRFSEKCFEIVGMTRTVANKASDKIRGSIRHHIVKWTWFKYLGGFEISAQIFSIIVLGTLLGAAYAVTMQSNDRNTANIAILSKQEVLHSSVFPKKVISEKTSPKIMPFGIESEIVFSLVSILNPRERYIVSTEVEGVTSEEPSSSTLKPDVIEPALSDYEQKKIRALEQQILQVQQQAERLDLSTLRLKGKLELLVVKNRALSDRLRHIDHLGNTIKKHLLTKTSIDM